MRAFAFCKPARPVRTTHNGIYGRAELKAISMQNYIKIAMATAFLSGCSTVSESDACDVGSLREVAAKPLFYSQKKFCGEVDIFRSERVVFLRADGTNSAADFIVTTDSLELLGSIGSGMQRYYIEATIDPMEECFTAPAGSESCVPFEKPIFIEVTTARRVS